MTELMVDLSSNKCREAYLELIKRNVAGIEVIKNKSVYSGIALKGVLESDLKEPVCMRIYSCEDMEQWILDKFYQQYLGQNDINRGYCIQQNVL